MSEQPLSAHDFGSAFKGFLEQAVTDAPGAEPPFVRHIREHLGVEPGSLAIVGQDFDSTDHANVQTALDAYLEPETRTAELMGFASALAGYQAVSLAALLVSKPAGLIGGPSVEVGPVQYVDVDVGSGRVLACIESALLFVSTESGPLVVLVGTGADYGPRAGKILVQAMAPERPTADRFLADLRIEMRRQNVFRGRVISLERRQFGPPKVRFHELPAIAREQIVLPAGVLERVERHTVGFGDQVEQLRKAGRHVRRGLLLHGAPGTGKTLTAMYVVARMPGRTTILLTGAALGLIEHSVALARMLEPSLVVLEDVDLVAERRTEQEVGTNAVLFELLNQMDGLTGDADVIFLLTSNRPELLEPALASRPGRIDQAVEIPLPDAECRRRLFALYSDGLELEVESLDRFVERTEGVSGAFVRELLRKATLFAADEGGELVVQDRHLDDALHELVVEGGALTQSLLGAPQASA
jgi:cell division protease FtsH